LHITKIKDKVKSDKNVIRLNGIIHNMKQAYKKMNDVIKQSTDKADAFIFQSKFSQLMFEKYIRSYEKPKAVICNGSEIKNNNVHTDPDFRYNFLAFSRWRPHKRLKSIIKSFIVADIKDACLLVAGDLDECGIQKNKMKKYFSNPNIKYLGVLSYDDIKRYLALSNAVIHLCWIDWCPNSVVESVCAGKTVICNNVGGTHEIVKPSNGIVCDIDEDYDLEPVDLYSPPKINTNIVADAIVKSVEEPVKISNDHVNINSVAKQYKCFLDTVMGI